MEESAEVPAETETAIEELDAVAYNKDEDQAVNAEPAEKEPVKINFPVVPVLAAFLLAVAGAGAFYWISRETKREAEAAAKRRERRRQRLLEEGAGAEEEFNRLLEEKRNRRQK